MKVSDALDSVVRALRLGAHPRIAKLALMSDGFSSAKSDTIIAWAILYNERTADEYREENLSVPQTQG